MSKTTGTTKRIPITKARVNLGALVKSVYSKKDKYILEKDGYPVAIILNIKEMEDLLDIKELEELEKSATSFVNLEYMKKKYAV